MAAGPARLDVLVVDGDTNIRASFGTILRSAGHQVDEAADAPSALEKLQAAGFGVVVVDVATALDIGVLARFAHSAPQVVLVFGPDAEVDVDMLMAAVQAFGHLHKPVDPIRLRTTVAAALAVHRGEGGSSILPEQGVAPA